MKGGDAVILTLAATVPEPVRDVTFILYEAEEIESEFNGLGQLTASDPDLHAGRLRDPDGALRRASSRPAARARCGSRSRPTASAPTAPGPGRASTPSTGRRPILERLTAYDARMPVIDGLTYHEGLNAVGISGGVAGNVLPDVCTVSVNYRFAPDRSEAEAEAFLRDFFEGYDVRVSRQRARRPARVSTGPRPRRSSRRSAARSTRSSAGPTSPASAALGVPAVNFGPGDPMLAHKQEEFVPLEQIRHCERVLTDWLRGDRRPTSTRSSRARW